MIFTRSFTGILLLELSRFPDNDDLNPFFSLNVEEVKLFAGLAVNGTAISKNELQR